MVIIQVSKVDAFTDKPLEGNPAGVVFGADGLSEEYMLKIASELNISETVFILKPTSNKANFKLKFYTPTSEVDLCGHATIAASYFLVKEGRIKVIEPTTIIKFETNVGIIPVEVYVEKGKPKIIYMTQATPEVKTVNINVEDVAGALRVNISEILDTNLPIQVASTGLSFLIIPVKSLNTLLSLKPNLLKVYELSKKLKVTGFHVFTFETLDTESTVHTRCFAPYVGVFEDPVTGTANGALGAYLVWNNAVKIIEPYTTIVSEQGYAMRRPGKAYVEVRVQDNKPIKVKVGGKAILTLKGELRIK